MTAAMLGLGWLPPDVAGAVPPRLALDLVQALVHGAKSMSRQGYRYHGLLVTLDVDPAYPSVQPPVLREVLAAQGWPRWLCEAAADFCHARRFSIRWAQFNFRSDTGLPQGPRGLRSCSVLYANHNPFATRVLNSCTWTATPDCRGVSTLCNWPSVIPSGSDNCAAKPAGVASRLTQARRSPLHSPPGDWGKAEHGWPDEDPDTRGGGVLLPWQVHQVARGLTGL